MVTSVHDCHHDMDHCISSAHYGRVHSVCVTFIQQVAAKTDCQHAELNTDRMLCSLQLDYPTGYAALSGGAASPCIAAAAAVGINLGGGSSISANSCVSGHYANTYRAILDISEVERGTLFSVSVGDLNGDGKADFATSLKGIMVAGPGNKIYAEYGPVAVGEKNVLITNTDFTATSSSFTIGGIILADINGDAIDDIIAYDAGGFKVLVILGSGSLPATLDIDSTPPDLVVSHSAMGLWSHFAVGNIDGNPGADLVVGDPDNAYVLPNAVVTAAMPGTLTEASATVTINKEPTGNMFTASIIGNFNAGGNPDLVLGDSGANGGNGKVYVFFGPLAGVIPAATAGAIITGAAAETIGTALGTVKGDWNGDGIEDLVLTLGESSPSGGLRVFYGGASLTGALTTAAADVTMYGLSPGDFFAHSVALGDVNGDGIDDMVVTAPGVNSFRGKIYVFYGGATPNTDVNNPDKEMGGGCQGDTLGFSVAVADLNGDGKNDIVTTTGGATILVKVHAIFGPDFDLA